MQVGLSGGVGSGKSTVARLLAERGAVIVDADAIARQVVEPGTPGFDAVVAEFGRDVVAADGRLDRAALAGVVFADEARRTALNAIVHPLIRARMAEVTRQAGGAAIVVQDVPLLVEGGRGGDYDAVVIVLADTDVRLRRLADRGMAEADARARMAAQATDEQRRAAATDLLDNNGSLADLTAQVDQLWRRLTERAAGTRAV